MMEIAAPSFASAGREFAAQRRKIAGVQSIASAAKGLRSSKLQGNALVVFEYRAIRLQTMASQISIEQ